METRTPETQRSASVHGDELDDDDKCSCVKCSRFRFLSCCLPICRKMPVKKEATPQPIEQPNNKFPYFGELPSDLKAGRVICVTGSILPNCLRFSINLRCGKTGDTDIAFHFNPRLNERYIVRNCKVNGRWGDEETTSITKFDISQYHNFNINILIAEEEYMVSLNGKHVCGFGFRIPLEKVRRIEVHGNVSISGVEYKEVTSYPDPDPNVYQIPIQEGDFEASVSDTAFKLPLTAALPTQLSEGYQLNIAGTVKILPHSFYINLQQGSQLWPHPIIPLHVNPRFCTSAGENIFVRNAWCNKSWGHEERTPQFPFAPGAPFTVTISKDPDFFSLWVDGNLVGEFRYRCPSDNIDIVYIQGDVHIKHIMLQKRLTEIYFNSSNSR